MEPRIRLSTSRRTFQFGAMSAGFTLLVGCTAPWMREKPSDFEKKSDAVRDALTAEDRPTLIRDVASPMGKHSRKFESFGLVKGLMGTGGECRPSSQRDYVINELRANDEKDPAALIDSDTTAMVKVLAVAPAGLPKGSRVDVEVSISRECDATSLRNGKLMDTRLQEYAVLGNSLRKGSEMARAQGSVLHLPIGFTKAEKIDYTQGRILGGAKVYDQRMMGIHIRESYAHVMTSNALSKAINDRFHVLDNNKRRGAAVPKDDGFIQLDLPSIYRHDPYHFLDVVLHVAFLENAERRAARIEEARLLLQEPTTARRAALQFEALGKDGKAPLRQGLNHPNAEIRFYSAYALAYLDDFSSIAVLEGMAGDFPEFRAASLIGLSAVEHYEARDALERLLQHSEPEVRYGALEALRKRDDSASLVNSHQLTDVVLLTEVPSHEPCVCVSLEEFPEIAVFGTNPPLMINEYFEINPVIVIRPDNDGMVRLSHFSLNGDDYAQICPSNLVSVLETLQQIGGTYNDMVHLIDHCARNGILTVPVAMNPRPKQGRVHQRQAEEAASFDGVASQDLEEINAVISSDEDDRAWWDVRRFWSSEKSQ